MALDDQLLAYLGARQQVELRGRPERRREKLNPQPIPPEELGAQVAVEILRLGWYARHLGVEPRPLSSWDEDIDCPVGVKVPVLPPGVFPPPDPEPGPDWYRAYLVGLAGGLAVSGDRSAFVVDAQDHVSRALAREL